MKATETTTLVNSDHMKTGCMEIVVSSVLQDLEVSYSLLTLQGFLVHCATAVTKAKIFLSSLN